MLRFFLFLALLEVASGYIVHSSANVQAFFEAEKRIVEGLGNYINYEKKRLVDLKKSSGYEKDIVVSEDRIGNLTKFLQQVKENYTEASQDEYSKRASHPTTVYHVLNSFVTNWNSKLNSRLYGKRFVEFLNVSKTLLPGVFDAEGSRLALLTIQRVYNISTKDIRSGNLLGHQGEPLNIVDVYDIGITALQKGFSQEASQWLQLVVDECEKEPNQTAFSVTSAYSQLSLAYHSLDKFDEAEAMIEKAHLLNESDTRLYMMYIQYRNKEVPRAVKHVDPDWWKNYTQLCSANTSVPKLLWYHRCRYRCSRDMFLFYKEEILSVSPYVSVIYDVIDNHTASQLTREASEKINSIDASTTGEWLRVTYLSDDNKKVKKLFSMIDKATGMRSKPVSGGTIKIEVMNYGIGGQYSQRYDVNPYNIANAKQVLVNKRMASVFIYFGDVEEGGATLFPNLKIRVAPKKGSALFWFNYKPDGRPEVNLERRQCPVVIGQKWTAHAWIWKYGNEDRRPSGKNSNSTQFAVERVTFPHNICRYP